VAVYIFVFVVFILILFGAYRSLGIAATAVASPERVLLAISRELRSNVEAMRIATENVASAAKEGRRTATGAAQQLSQIEEGDDDRRSAVELLGAAAESCGWAGRLMESEAYPANPGLQEAASGLLDHAAQCLAAVVIDSAENSPSDTEQPVS